MESKRRESLLLLLVSLLFLPMSLGFQDQMNEKQMSGLVLSTSGNGGNHAASSNQWLRSTLGQPQPIGTVSSNNYRLEAGFWPATRKQTVSSVEDVVPRAHHLGQVYPNPFNPSTTISYAVAREGRVRIEIFDLRGQKIATLLDEVTPAGWYTVTWNGKSDRGIPWLRECISLPANR